MLNFLRKYSRHWIIGVIIFLIAVAFIFTFGYSGMTSGPSKEVATVNGQPITISAFQRQFNNILQQYQEMSRGEMTEEMIKAMRLKDMALIRLIDRALILQAGERLGLTVSDDELREQIRSYPGFQRDGRFDERIYEMQLSGMREKKLDFEEQQREQLLIKKVVDELTSLAKVSNAEIEEGYRLGKEAVKVSYLAVTPDKFLAKQQPREADLARYYQDHQGDLRLPSRARVSYFAFRAQDFQDKVKLTPQEVENFIKKHPAEFSRPKVIKVRQILLTIPAKADAKVKERLTKQAQDLLAKLKAGQDFADTARKESQDPASREKGGDLGYVSRGQHPPEWDRAAFALRTGDIGRADTPQGIYLLKVEEVKETEKIPEAENRVSLRLKSEKAKALAQEAAREARTALSQGAAAEIAKKYGISLKETPLFGLKDQVPGLGMAPGFNQAALQLKAGETSRVVNLPDGFAVMKSLEYQAEHLPPLEQVKDRVAQQVKKQAALKEAEQEAAKLQDRLKKGETLAKVAAAAGLSVKESGFFTRFEGFEKQQGAEALTSAAFLLSKEHPLGDKPILWQDKYYLLAFKERRPMDQAEFQKDQDKLKAQFLEQKKQMMLQSWLEAERRQAKIKRLEMPN